jgi:hypothetical protein
VQSWAATLQSSRCHSPMHQHTAVGSCRRNTGSTRRDSVESAGAPGLTVCVAQERAACSTALSSDQLSSLTTAPRQLDFGKLSPASPGQQPFLITNPLASPIHVVVNVSAIEGLSCAGPCSQVVPPGATAKFVLQLHCHDTQHLKEHIQYIINGVHFQVSSNLHSQCRGDPALHCTDVSCGRCQGLRTSLQ